MTAEQITTAMMACRQAELRAFDKQSEAADMAKRTSEPARTAYLDHAAYWQHEAQRYREAHAALTNLPHSNENTNTETK